MYISYSHVHGLRPEKLSHLISLPNSFLTFQCPLLETKLHAEYSPYFWGDECSSYFSGGPLNDTHYRCFLGLAAAILEY